MIKYFVKSKCLWLLLLFYSVAQLWTSKLSNSLKKEKISSCLDSPDAAFCEEVVNKNNRQKWSVTTVQISKSDKKIFWDLQSIK